MKRNNDQHTIWLVIREATKAGSDGMTSEAVAAHFEALGRPITKNRAAGALSRMYLDGCLERRQDTTFTKALRFKYSAPDDIREPLQYRGGAQSKENQPFIKNMVDVKPAVDDDDTLEGFSRRLKDSFGFFDTRRHVGFHETNAFLGIRKGAA